jgi:hypothetical protein
MNYNTALSIRHFSDPGFVILMRHLFIHFALTDPLWPRGNELNRAWEQTAAARAMRDLGYMQRGRTALVVGSAMDLLAYLLTDYIDEVVRTTEPQEPPLAIRPWRRDRQTVLTNASALPQRTFDVVLISEELSELGSMDRVAARMKELAGCVNDGGLMVVLTEIQANQSRTNGFENKVFFTQQQVQDHIISPTGLIPIDRPQLDIDDETRSTSYPFEEAATKGIRKTNLMLSKDDLVWTSACIVLKKKQVLP